MRRASSKNSLEDDDLSTQRDDSANNNNNNSGRKRLRKSTSSASLHSGEALSLSFDPKTSPAALSAEVMELSFPEEFETLFATAIFELGLRHSSPKVLMPFMPPESGLSTEHLKSHLQKNRMHKSRSTEEFVRFFEDCVRAPFHTWESARGWESNSNINTSSQRSNNRLLDCDSLLMNSSIALESEAMQGSFLDSSPSLSLLHSDKDELDSLLRVHQYLMQTNYEIGDNTTPLLSTGMLPVLPVLDSAHEEALRNAQ